VARLSHTKQGIVAAVIAASVLLSQPSLAQSPAAPPPAPVDPGFDNSPDNVDNQLNESDERVDSLFPIDPLQPLHRVWERVTRRLRQTIGLDLGLNYTGLYQRADKALPRQQTEAGGGDLDFFGRWDLHNRGGRWPGALVFFTETRHRYTEIPPSDLGGAIGSLWGTTNAFTTQDYALTQLYWEQGSREDRLVYRLGKMDPDTIYDRSRYVSANEAFLSQAFSATLAMPVPNTGLGGAVAISPITNTYIVGGVHDANGAKTSFGEIEKGELFAAIELGVAPRHGKPGAGLYHVTLWHSDEREEANIPSGRGIALTLQQELGPDGDIVPFFRYSYGDGGATPVRQAIALGLGLEKPFGQNNDLIGIGFSWGQPTDSTLQDQYVLEAFYRLQVTPHTNLSPDIQVIFNPAKNPAEDSITVGSIRLRTPF
jgi:porin